MARFAGLVGFSHTVRTARGVSSEVITEKGPYFGTVTRAAMSPRSGTEQVNTELSLSNTIEIMADDDYLSENIFAIRFVEWGGALWKVAEVTDQRPRLLLRLGGVYLGARAKSGTPAEASDTP